MCLLFVYQIRHIIEKINFIIKQKVTEKTRRVL